MITDITFFHLDEDQTVYIKKVNFDMNMYLWCVLLSLICYVDASCAPIKNGHYHLTSIRDINTTRECVWELQPGIAYLELERYSGRFGHIDKFAHMNLTLGSNVVNIANGEIRFRDQRCITETTTRLEFQLWIALVFHTDRVTVKVLAPAHDGPFVECVTFYHVKNEPELTVSAYTELGMEQVVRRVGRRPPKLLYSTPSDSTKKSLHDLDRRLTVLEREMDEQMEMSSKMAAQMAHFLKKFKLDVSSSMAISIGNRVRLSRHFSSLCVLGLLLCVLCVVWFKNNLKNNKKKL